MISFWGNEIDCGDGCTTVTILKATEMFTLNRGIVWYVNYVSIKLFKNKLAISGP